MSKLLSIQWSHQRLLVVGASPVSGGVQVDRAFSIELPAEQVTEESIAETVATAFKQNGIGRADAIIVLDRDCVEIRQFDVPPVPANELPDLVHFQANTQFTSFSDTWALDFVPLGLDKDHQATSVLACALSPQLLAQIKECLESAGVRIRNITVRGFAAISLANPKPGDGEQIIIQRVDNELDLTAIESTNVLLTRTVKLPSAEAGELVGKKIGQEFKRTLASCSNQHARENFKTIKIIGRSQENQFVADAIQEAADVTVEFIDPAEVSRWKPTLIESVSGQVGDYGPAVGSLISKARHEKFVVDLLNPRTRPSEDQNDRRLYWLGGIAASIAVLVFAGAYWFLSMQQNDLEKLQTKLEELKELNETADQTIAEVEKINQWKRGDINLLDEFTKISGSLPLGDDAMVDQLNGSYQVTTSDYRLNLDGRITRTEFSRDIDRELRNAAYNVDPGADIPRSNDPVYKNNFKKTLLIHLQDREIEEYDIEPEPSEGDNKAAGENAAGENAAGENAAGENAAGENAAGENATGKNKEEAGKQDK